MAEDKRLLILGSKSGGAATWGQITGTLSNQTDLKDALDAKADSSSIPTATSDLTNDSGYITLSDVPAQVQADWNQTTTTAADYIKNKPTIPTVDVTAAGDNTFTGNNTFSNDTLVGDLNDIGINLSVVSYGIPVIEGYDNNTSRSFSLSTDGFKISDTNLGDYEGLNITLDGSTGDVSIASNFGNIDLQASSVTVNSNPVVTNDILDTETLTFIDANNVSTTVVVYTQPQI